MVSQKLLSELKVILKEDYGISLKPSELSEIGNGLVQFFELLIKVELDQETTKKGVLANES